MAQNRGRQKQLEKKRKKRQLEQRRAKQAIDRTGDKQLVAEAAGWPVEAAYLSAGWEAPIALVHALVVRRSPGGRLVVGVALVDRSCLGIKDGFARPTSPEDLDSMIAGFEEMHGGMQGQDFATVQSVVFHALDYARSLGFEPHRDFPAGLFGPRPAELPPVPGAKPSRPVFMQGPYDDARRIVAQLARTVGPGNFDVVLGGPMGTPAALEEAAAMGARDEDDEDDEDDEE